MEIITKIVLKVSYMVSNKIIKICKTGNKCKYIIRVLPFLKFFSLQALTLRVCDYVQSNDREFCTKMTDFSANQRVFNMIGKFWMGIFCENVCFSLKLGTMYT